jgi:hypothetical protein
MSSGLEEKLCAAYRQQADCYRRAVAVVAQVPAALAQADQGVLMKRLAAILDDIAAIDSGMRASKQAWQAAGRSPGPELQAAVGEVGGLIQELLRHVGSAEQQALAVTKRLAPELDQLIRSRQMQTAYRGTMAQVRSQSSRRIP